MRGRTVRTRGRRKCSDAWSPPSPTAAATTVALAATSQSRRELRVADSSAIHHMMNSHETLFAVWATTEDVDLPGGSTSIEGWGKLHVELESVTGDYVCAEVTEVALFRLSTSAFYRHRLHCVVIFFQK